MNALRIAADVAGIGGGLLGMANFISYRLSRWRERGAVPSVKKAERMIRRAAKLLRQVAGADGKAAIVVGTRDGDYFDSWGEPNGSVLVHRHDMPFALPAHIFDLEDARICIVRFPDDDGAFHQGWPGLMPLSQAS